MKLRSGALDDNVYGRSVLRRLDGVTQPKTMHAAQYGSPFTLPSRHAGMLAAVTALNDAAACGIRPEELEASILLPEGSEEALLRSMVDELRDTAKTAGVRITSCCAETGDVVTRPVILARAQGTTHYFPCDTAKPAVFPEPGSLEYGTSNRNPSEEKPEEKETGREILVIGRIGLEGTFLLASERRQELKQRFPVRMLDRAERMQELLLMMPAMEALSRSGIVPSFVINGTGGGIYAALWELARQSGTGFAVELPELPVFQETIEFTDYYGINPYQMRAGGCLVLTVPDAEKACRLLAEQGIYSKPVGKLTEEKKRLLINGEEQQNLNRPDADSLLAVLEHRTE